MKYNSVTVNTDVEIYVGEVMESINDEDLIDELTNRGYYVFEVGTKAAKLDIEDWKLLLSLLDKNPMNTDHRRLYDKILSIVY